MELKVKQVTFPEVIEFNFEELQKGIAEKVEHYKCLVYTENQVKDAKKDVANLRKFAKALSDERIRIKKQCLEAYTPFEEKINKLVAMIDEPINLIANQVHDYEEKQKEEKQALIQEYINILGDWFLGFQLHESASNRRNSDWQSIIKKMNGSHGPYDVAELKKKMLLHHKTLPDGSPLS